MGKLDTVYLIDDDSIVNLVNKVCIQRTGLVENIVVFTNAKDALEQLTSHIEKEEKDSLPNLIVLDINMPLMSGFELLEAFQNYKSQDILNIPVMMLSSSEHEQDIATAMDFNNVKKFITKPITVEIFDKFVKEHF